MPTGPLSSEVLLARIVVNQSTIHLWGSLNCFLKVVLFEWGQLVAKVGVEMSRQMFCSCLHNWGELQNSWFQCGQIVFRPSVLPFLPIFTLERIHNRIWEEWSHVGISSIKESVLSVLPTNLIEMFWSLKSLSCLSWKIGQFPRLK